MVDTASRCISFGHLSNPSDFVFLFSIFYGVSTDLHQIYSIIPGLYIVTVSSTQALRSTERHRLIVGPSSFFCIVGQLAIRDGAILMSTVVILGPTRIFMFRNFKSIGTKTRHFIEFVQIYVDIQTDVQIDYAYTNVQAVQVFSGCDRVIGPPFLETHIRVPWIIYLVFRDNPYWTANMQRFVNRIGQRFSIFFYSRTTYTV